MADNLTLQDTSLASLPTSTPIAALAGALSGDDPVYAGVGLLAKSAGSEGSRTFTVISPATEDTLLAILAALLPATSGGYTHSHLVCTGSVNATVQKASAGQLYRCGGFNNAAYEIHIKFHNTASTPTAGSTAVYATVTAQAGQPFLAEWPAGLPFSTGIAFTIVKGMADNDATAVVAADCLLELDYK